MAGTVTLAHYLFTRLRQMGVDSMHGVPGDFNLVALDYLDGAGVHWVGDANELNAGYAADGYARVKGMGALVTTFGVGELSALNAIAGSYAEYVPVVHIVGSPNTAAQRGGLLLHHTLGNGDFRVFSDIHKRVTCAQASLHDVKTACREIDEVLKQCWLQSRPVYIELPSDMVVKQVDETPLKTPLERLFPENEPEAESVAVDAILQRLYAAQRPCVLVDGCVLRRHVKADVEALVRHTGLPTFVCPMGKSGVDETLPNFGGMYAGDASYDSVREFVDSSDCVIAIGLIKSDLNTAGFTYRISTLNSIDLHTGLCQIGYASYNLQMRGVLRALTKHIELDQLTITPFECKPGREAASALRGTDYPAGTITHEQLWPRLSQWLRPGDIVLTEAGTAAIGLWDTRLPSGAICISQPLWASIGFTLAAAQGAAQAARELGKGQRVILFEGDGSFQMTAQSIGTMIRNKLDLVVVVINNDGYTIERWVHGMDAEYNDVCPWRYSKFPEAMGAKMGEDAFVYEIETEDQLEELWTNGTLDKPKGLMFVEMFMPRDDAPIPLKLIGAQAEKLNAS